MSETDSRILELPPAPRHFHFGTTEFVGSLYYQDPAGNQIGEESIYTSAGEPRVTFRATDTRGVNVTGPFEALGFTLEGENGISGVAHHMVERDILGRPKKIIGYRVSNDFTGNLLDATNRRVAGDEGVEDFFPGGYEETVLNYDSQTGLLNTVVETVEQNGTIIKTVHRNVFNAQGQRTGYIKSELTDIDASTGRENYDIAEVIIYEDNGDNWREITYVGFRDGLVPVILKEGSGDKPFSGREDICYLRPNLPREQWPYQITANTGGTTLVEQRGFDDGTQTATLPSWIPKAAAYYIANQALTLDEAAETPYFTETRDTEILTREEALQELYQTETPEQICALINRLRTKETVVFQSMRVPLSLMREIMYRSQEIAGRHILGAFSEAQKLAIIAAMHPAFGREEVVPPTLLGEHTDHRHFDMLLKWLATDKPSVTQLIYSLDGLLSQDSLRCFSYLLAENNNT